MTIPSSFYLYLLTDELEKYKDEIQQEKVRNPYVIFNII